MSVVAIITISSAKMQYISVIMTVFTLANPTMLYWVLHARTLVFLALAGAALALTPCHAWAQATCSMRGDLASNANVHWEDLRAACDAEQTAFKQKDPVGFSW